MGLMKLWHWDDATKMASWFELNANKTTEYGLNIPYVSGFGIPKEEYDKFEDQVTDRFVAEMSKRPKINHANPEPESE